MRVLFLLFQSKFDTGGDRSRHYTLPSMAGLYWDMTLLASVGSETATNTIRRQAILYSSSGLMFSAEGTSEMSHVDSTWYGDDFSSLWFSASHHFSGRTEPRPVLGRSHRVNLPPMTARRRSWPPCDKVLTLTTKRGTEHGHNDKPDRNVRYLHVRLTGNVVLEIFYWTDQKRNVTG